MLQRIDAVAHCVQESFQLVFEPPQGLQRVDIGLLHFVAGRLLRLVKASARLFLGLCDQFPAPLLTLRPDRARAIVCRLHDLSLY